MFNKHEAEQRARHNGAQEGAGVARPTKGREAW
jgi:hypothetical protein